MEERRKSFFREGNELKTMNQKGIIVPFLYIVLLLLGVIAVIFGGFAVLGNFGLYAVSGWIIGFVGKTLLGKVKKGSKKGAIVKTG